MRSGAMGESSPTHRTTDRVEGSDPSFGAAHSAIRPRRIGAGDLPLPVADPEQVCLEQTAVTAVAPERATLSNQPLEDRPRILGLRPLFRLHSHPVHALFARWSRSGTARSNGFREGPRAETGRLHGVGVRPVS